VITGERLLESSPRAPLLGALIRGSLTAALLSLVRGSEPPAPAIASFAPPTLVVGAETPSSRPSQDDDGSELGPHLLSAVPGYPSPALFSFFSAHYYILKVGLISEFPSPRVA